MSDWIQCLCHNINHGADLAVHRLDKQPQKPGAIQEEKQFPQLSSQCIQKLQTQKSEPAGNNPLNPQTKQLQFQSSTRLPMTDLHSISTLQGPVRRIDTRTSPERKKSCSFPSPAHRTSSTCGRLGCSSSASFWSCWYFLLKKPNYKGENAVVNRKRHSRPQTSFILDGV